MGELVAESAVERRPGETSSVDCRGSRWPFVERPDERLCTQVRLLGERLAQLDAERLARLTESGASVTRMGGHDDQEGASERAKSFLDIARNALQAKPVRNEEAWAAFHAARREEIRLLAAKDLALLAVSLSKETHEKLTSWRKEAIEAYGGDALAACRALQKRWRLWRRRGREDRWRRDCAECLVRIQQHLDEQAENDNRKRRLQQGQFITYVVVLVAVLVCLLVLQLFGRGVLVLDHQAPADAWWVVNAVLFGTLGGAFSAAQRVASTGPKGRYPVHRWQRVGTAFHAAAGGAAALVGFAAVHVGLLGPDALSGPRVAFVSFLAGFSERFIPSLAKQQGG